VKHEYGYIGHDLDQELLHSSIGCRILYTLSLIRYSWYRCTHSWH